MKTTIEHSASSYGQPVILDDNGQLMDYGPGIKAALKKLNMTAAEFAEACGAKRQTVYNWIAGTQMPSAAALNVLGQLLDKSK